MAKQRAYEVEVKSGEGRVGLMNGLGFAIVVSGDRYGPGYYRVTVERIPEPAEDDKNDDD